MIMKLIPDGWFDDDVLSKAWEKQKYVTENGALFNMLDNVEFMNSIKKLN